MKRERYPEYPFRIFMEDGTVHLIHRIGLSQVAVEFPEAARIERPDKRQPLPPIETSGDA